MKTEYIYWWTCPTSRVYWAVLTYSSKYAHLPTLAAQSLESNHCGKQASEQSDLLRSLHQVLLFSETTQWALSLKQDERQMKHKHGTQKVLQQTSMQTRRCWQHDLLPTASCHICINLSLKLHKATSDQTLWGRSRATGSAEWLGGEKWHSSILQSTVNHHLWHYAQKYSVQTDLSQKCRSWRHWTKLTEHNGQLVHSAEILTAS